MQGTRTRPAGAAPAAGASPGRAGFRRDIEGMRGIAVLLVVLYHAGVAAVSGGFVGVDVFFVLSGYLITGLLVRERDSTGRIDFARFYARRARRLLPAAATMLLGTLAIGAIVYSPMEQARYARTALATALYASNIAFIRASANYFAPALAHDPFLHTWSLAVEEQFYLFWPLLIAIASPAPRRHGWRVGLIALVTVTSFIACVRYTADHTSWTFFGSPFRAWEFGIGALASLLPASIVSAHRDAFRALSWTGIAIVIASAFVISPLTPFPGAAAMLPAAGTVMALPCGSTMEDAGAGRLLNIRALQQLGRLSYSWYLWHWPVLLLAAAVVPTMTAPIALAGVLLSLAMAAGMHYAIENPIRFHPLLVPRPRLSLLLAGALTATSVVGCAAAWRWSRAVSTHEPYPTYEAASADRTATMSCATWTVGQWTRQCDGPTSPLRPTIVVFGDSHAAQWLPAITGAAGRAGLDVVSITEAACPASDVAVYNARHSAEDRSARCGAWRGEAMERIAALHPALIVVASSREHVDGTNRKDRRRRVSAEEWRAGTHRTFEALATMRLPVLYLRDTPRLGFDAPECLARASWRRRWRTIDCRAERAAALDAAVYQAEVDAARDVPAVRIVDLTDLFCDADSCGPRRDGIIVYSDFDHITASFARHLSAAIEARIDVLLAQSRPE